MEETEHRIHELRNIIRTDHLNDMEGKSTVKICEEYLDIFDLPGDRVSLSTAVEHAILTLDTDPCRGTVGRNCRKELSPARNVKANYR
jgi:hypothetical protein